MPTTAPERMLILASTSRYRAEALSRLGLPFTTADPRIDETPLPAESPDTLALRLAHAKAAQVARLHPEAVVIGSDQVGHCAGRLLTKPGNLQRAVDQLCAASGHTAEFYTAVAVHQGERAEAQVVPTELAFRVFSERQARAYAQKDQPWDCAGSFKAESLGIALFQRVSSQDPTALIGLPLIATVSLLSRFGISPLA